MTKQEQMFALMEEQEQSNQTIAAFCAVRDIKMKTFFYWRRKYRTAQSVPAGFVPITPPANNPGPLIGLTYPNGVTVHLPAADLSLIAQLIRLA